MEPTKFFLLLFRRGMKNKQRYTIGLLKMELRDSFQPLWNLKFLAVRCFVFVHINHSCCNILRLIIA